ncbi:2-dehydro-3-deoxy-6-phosphogalactonate aldolase [Sphingobium chungangianum]
MNWTDVFCGVPLIAILRGLTVSEARPIGEALVNAGFRCAEVTLNSSDPLECIAILQREFGNELLVGAGTVLSEGDVDRVAGRKGRIIISPNVDPVVIRATKRHGLISLPAFSTASEAFTALEAGADGLKLFPAEASNPAALRAMRAVLPPAASIFPVGGIDAASMASWRKAGASGFGIGGSLYKPGRSAGEIRQRAETLIHAWRALEK